MFPILESYGQDSALIMQYYDKAGGLDSSVDVLPYFFVREADHIFMKLGRQNTHWYAILAAALSLPVKLHALCPCSDVQCYTHVRCTTWGWSSANRETDSALS